jgi:hypothetical protein
MRERRLIIMNECSTEQSRMYTSCASLAALGVKVHEMDLFEPIRRRVQIAQKTVKDQPIDKVYDGWIAMLAGAHGLVEINSRLRAEPALQVAFGRKRCAEQSVVQQTLDACTDENVQQMEEALDEIYRQHSQGCQHDFQREYLILDVDLSGMPCGPTAAFATKGYFAKQRNRRGRQLGRVLASQYDEVVIDRLFEGTVQLNRALIPLMQAAERTLGLDEAKRRRTIVRVDAGGGSVEDINCLLARGYQVIIKDYSTQRAGRLAQSVTWWAEDAKGDGRTAGRLGANVGHRVCPPRAAPRRALSQSQRSVGRQRPDRDPCSQRGAGIDTARSFPQQYADRRLAGLCGLLRPARWGRRDRIQRRQAGTGHHQTLQETLSRSTNGHASGDVGPQRHCLGASVAGRS